MAKALLLTLDKEFSDLLTLNLALFINFEVIVKDNLEEGLVIIDSLPDLDLIIVPDKIGEANIALGIHNHLNSCYLDIPLLIVGHEPTLVDEHIMIEGPANWQKVIKYAAKIMDISPLSLVDQDIEDFYPVLLRYFYRIETCICDIYLAIPRSTEKSKLKFIKRIPVNETIDQSLLDKWYEQGVEKLYIEKESRLKFGKAIAQSILDDLDNPNLSPIEKIQVQSDAYQYIGEEVAEMGLSKESIKMADKTIDSMKETIASDKTLKDLLDELEKNKTSYLFKHALLISYIGHHIMDLAEWGSEEQSSKLAFVAFFHDLTLVNPIFAQVETEEELKGLELSEDEEKAVSEHALKASMLFRTYPQLPIGADIIIKQHHGAVNGIGYPEYISSRVSPLAIIFIVCEEYVNMILTDDDFDKDSAILELREKYSQMAFKRALDAIDKLDC